LASTESGREGNDSGGGDFPSILFRALRMELNIMILQICRVYAELSQFEIFQNTYWLRCGISKVLFSR
jgi:hypothetical protein